MPEEANDNWGNRMIAIDLWVYAKLHSATCVAFCDTLELVLFNKGRIENLEYFGVLFY
jgi:hypothetical protein